MANVGMYHQCYNWDFRKILEAVIVIVVAATEVARVAVLAGVTATLAVLALVTLKVLVNHWEKPKKFNGAHLEGDSIICCST